MALDSVEILTNAAGLLAFAMKVGLTMKSIPPGTEAEDEIRTIATAHLDEALTLSKQLRQDIKD